MARIVYLSFSTGQIVGGQKMIMRHVETLRELGFDAVVWMNSQGKPPTWVDHQAPVIVEQRFAADDILVLPEDAPRAIGELANSHATVLFGQNQYALAIHGLPALDRLPADRMPAFIAVGRSVADLVLRAYPQARVEMVRCFADERVFRPGPARQGGIAMIPRKRPAEAVFIRQMFAKLYPQHAVRPWRRIEKASEAQVAEVLGASDLFLSLSRLESVGMTPLEAMASGCVCAGFTGVGGREFATAENGFWAPEDDCMAATDALGAAADIVATRGPALDRILEAGRETAREWSYARFRIALEEVWMRLAPRARVRDGPL